MHLTANISLLDNVFFAEKESGFNGESQQFCESNLSVLEQWNLSRYIKEYIYCMNSARYIYLVNNAFIKTEGNICL